MMNASGYATLFLFISLSVFATGDKSKTDYYYHQPKVSPSMWVFGKTGVMIYSDDGKDLLKSNANTEICEEASSRGVTSNNCGFKGVVSDGNNYIWATNTQGGSFVEVFSIESGAHVASLPTCGFVWNIDFHPLRNEIWVQCWSPNAEAGDEGHVDVFSASALSLDNRQILTGDLSLRGHGTVVVDSSLPRIAYGNVLSSPILSEIDTNTMQVINNYTVPLVSGLYRMEYSHVNRHLFMRAYICCSCGIEGADKAECSFRGDPSYVDVVTGPNPAMNVTGYCGHSCEGTAADSIGIYEWDTVNKTMVSSHTTKTGISGDPYVSPDGKYLIILANDGGRVATIIATGKNGEPSERIAEINTLFSEVDEEKGISDVCFIDQGDKQVVLFASTLANFVVLADMSNLESGGSILTKKIWLADESITEIDSNHGRGAVRSCAWATGTNYVWVDADKAQKVHVIELSADGDIDKAAVIRSIEGVDSRMMIHGENHATTRMNDVIQTQIDHFKVSMVDPVRTDIKALETDILGTQNSVLGLKPEVQLVKNSMASVDGKIQELYDLVDSLNAKIATLEEAKVTDEKLNDVEEKVDEVEETLVGQEGEVVNVQSSLNAGSDSSNTSPSGVAIAGLVLGICSILLVAITSIRNFPSGIESSYP